MKKNPKLNKRLFLTIIEKVIFGTGQIVCQGWFHNENVNEYPQFLKLQ